MLHALYGLFRRGPLDDLEIDDGVASVRWDGGAFGGEGSVSFPFPLLDVDQLKRAIAGEIPIPDFDEDLGSWMWVMLHKFRNEKTHVRALAVFAKAFELHGQEGAFCVERVVEILHGPRNQRRSRQRQTRPVADLMLFFEKGYFILDGRQKPPKRPLRRDTGQYTGVVRGPLLRRENKCGRVSTLRVNEDFYKLVTGEKSATYSDVDTEILRLDIKGHTNRHGNRPSRARRVLSKVACVSFARSAENRARDGKLDRVKAETLYGRWGLTSGKITASTLDVLEEDLAHVAACGGPKLVGPIDRHRQPGLSWVCLRLSDAASQAVSARRVKYGHRRPSASRPSASRPPVEATRSGRAGSHGPP